MVHSVNRMKFLIPAVLASIIVVAGIFAFVPVNDASTVHTQIGVLVTKTVTGQVLGGGNAVVDILADSAALKVGTVCAQVTDANLNDDIDIRVEVDAAGAQVANVDTNDNADDCSTFVGYRLFFDGASDAGDLVTYTVSWRVITP